MIQYRNSEVVQAGKIAEISGILQGAGGTVSCVIRFEDGASSQEDFILLAKNSGAVGSYIVKYASGAKVVMTQSQFEAIYSKV